MFLKTFFEKFKKHNNFKNFKEKRKYFYRKLNLFKMKKINVIFVILIFYCCSVNMTNIVDCSATMTNTIVDCSGLTKEQVLVALYRHSLLNNQKVPAPLRMMMAKTDMGITEDEAERVLASSQYIDYFKAVMIKTDFSKFPLLDSRFFDIDTGSGSMSCVVDSLRKNEILEAV